MGVKPLILLDTHVWIWAIVSPEKLSSRQLDFIEVNRGKISISTITIWECMFLAQEKRIDTFDTPRGMIEYWLDLSRVSVVPVTTEISMLSRELAFDHKDPADRFIAATAYSLNCPLVTADEKLARLNWLSTIH